MSAPVSDEAERLLGTVDTARVTGLSRYVICRAIDEGRIPSWRTPGGHRRVRRSDVEREFCLVVTE